MNPETTASVTEPQRTVFKAKCPRCGRVFENEHGQAQVDQAVRMHIARSHTHKLDPNKDARARKIAADPEKPKRKYTKRSVKPETMVTLNFCPNCGLDLHKVATGVVLAAKL